MPISISDCAKVVRFGKVAVVYSPQHGAGWYSWHGVTELMFDPGLVDLIERGANAEEIETHCNGLFPEDTKIPYLGGLDELVIEWIPEGTVFRIHEYDGAEEIILQDDDDWIVA
jgi:hypothetical protein